MYTAAVHPPRRVAPFLAVLTVAAMLPLLYQGWTAATAADLGVRLLLWLALSGLAMMLLGTLRAQRQALRQESDHAQELAHQDPLTGLGNRRRLMSDIVAMLPTASETSPLLLATFDLDGFKGYNDTYGHPAGDVCCRAWAPTSRGHRAYGDAYRMGGDEFCVLVTPGGAAAQRSWGGAAALSDHGQGFGVESSYGGVVLPHEGRADAAALRVADHRMYAQNNPPRLGRPPATDTLLQVLTERSPDLGLHIHEVAVWPAGSPARISLPAEDPTRCSGPPRYMTSAEGRPGLHPAKPGPLSREEWDFIRAHTVVRRTHPRAAPALKPAARLVRASHEHLDGSGYPDGLRGREIPLAARIIAVCDAYDTMTSTRPDRTALSRPRSARRRSAAARGPVRPRVVDAFCAAIGERAADTAVG